MAALISLRNIILTQGKRFCLFIDALDINAQRITVLTGPNGAGKSTLLKTLALLHTPHNGTLGFSGDQILASGCCASEYRRKVTLVDQFPYLLSGTVTKNIAFGLKVRGFSGQEQVRRIDSALEMVGLSGIGLRKACELSGGETQRVALARALALKPEVLLLDEPTANIDKGNRQAIETLIKQLPEQGVSVIMSTHDVGQTERLAGDVVCLTKRDLLEEQVKKIQNYPYQMLENTVWQHHLLQQEL